MKLNISPLFLMMMIFSLSLFTSSIYAQVCSAHNEADVDSDCNSNGYCIGFVNPGCSCLQGFVGDDCAEDDTGVCVPQEVIATKSDLETEIAMSMSAGVLRIEVDTVLEENQSYDDDNHARWTRIFFDGDENEVCAYPSALEWTKTINDACREFYVHEDSFSQTRNCFEQICFDSDDEEVLGCDASLCDAPPCRREFQAIMTIQRSYEKTNGRLNAIDSSSTENRLTVIYPWVESVALGGDSPFGIDIVTPANVQNNVLLLSADYKIIEDEWTIMLRSSVLYPWRLEASDAGLLFGGFVSSITTNCEVGVDDCIQEIAIVTNGCDTFADDVNLASENLLYVCNAESEADCPNPSELAATVTVIVGATTSCEAIVEIAPFTLDMETYDPDYATPRSSFIGGSTDQRIQFKITATAGSDQDTIAEVNLIALFSGYDDRNILEEAPADVLFETVICTEVTDQCFSVPANTVIPALEDDSTAVEDIIFTAYVEVLYENGKKRTFKRGLFENGEVSVEATLIVSPIAGGASSENVVESQDESSAYSVLVSLMICGLMAIF